VNLEEKKHGYCQTEDLHTVISGTSKRAGLWALAARMPI
jgi:hypothetical protein